MPSSSSLSSLSCNFITWLRNKRSMHIPPSIRGACKVKLRKSNNHHFSHSQQKYALLHLLHTCWFFAFHNISFSNRQQQLLLFISFYAGASVPLNLSLSLFDSLSTCSEQLTTTTHMYNNKTWCTYALEKEKKKSGKHPNHIKGSQHVMLAIILIQSLENNGFTDKV